MPEGKGQLPGSFHRPIESGNEASNMADGRCALMSLKAKAGKNVMLAHI